MPLIYWGVNLLLIWSGNYAASSSDVANQATTIVLIKDYSVMIDRRNFFDQPVKNDMRT